MLNKSKKNTRDKFKCFENKMKSKNCGSKDNIINEPAKYPMELIATATNTYPNAVQTLYTFTDPFGVTPNLPLKYYEDQGKYYIQCIRECTIELKSNASPTYFIGTYILNNPPISPYFSVSINCTTEAAIPAYRDNYTLNNFTGVACEFPPPGNKKQYTYINESVIINLKPGDNLQFYVTYCACVDIALYGPINFYLYFDLFIIS